MIGASGSPIPLLILASSLVPAVVIFFLRDSQGIARTTLNLGGAGIKVLLVATLIPAAVAGDRFEWSAPFLPGLELSLRVEPFALYFLALSAVLWLLTTIYAVGYLETAPNRSRFFGFFSLCVVATTGVALSGNLITFLVFYELLTLTTYPLVAHSQSTAAMRGARTYLIYTLTGGALLLAGVVWLTHEVGTVEFADRGSPALAEWAAQNPLGATVIFAILLTGLGVKAALVPLHGWLPRAMVAPAPVSALLHAVAVVKAGAFGVILLIDYVYGVELAADLGVLPWVAAIAAVTILYGSVRALSSDGLKQRLAYSTVSQVSYIVLGISILSVMSTTGAIAHMVNQGVMKITMFFCAGIFMEVLRVEKVSQMDGIGRRMPLTSAAFTLAALGMIGIPPLAGFLSKWYLMWGAAEVDDIWVIGLLVLSSLLNAAYFLPIIHRIWWREPTGHWQVPPTRVRRRVEAQLSLLVPTLVAAGLIVLIGLLAGAPYSPLNLAREITERIYGL